MQLRNRNFFIGSILFLLSIGFYTLYKINQQSSWWQISTHGEIFLSPIVTNNKVYFANNLGEIYAINKKTGKLSWSTQLSARDPYNISGYMDKLFVLTPSGKLFCLSMQNGQILWTFATDNQMTLSAYFHIQNNVMYINSSDAAIYAINIKNGSLLWKFTSQSRINNKSEDSEKESLNLFGRLEFYKNKLIYSSIDGFVYMIEVKTGKIVWQTSVGQLTTTIHLKGNILYVAKEDGAIVALRFHDGRIIYKNSENKNQIMCFRNTSILQDLFKSFSFSNIKHVINYPLLIVTKNGKFIAASTKLDSFDEMFDLKTKLVDCPQIINNHGYAFTTDGAAISFNPHEKLFNQYGQISEILLFNPKLVQYLHLPFEDLFTKYELGTISSDSDGGFSLLKNSNGEKIWSYSSIGKVVSAPTIDNKFIYFTDTDGRLSRILLKDGKIPVVRAKKNFQVEQKNINIGSNQAYEFTISYDESKFPNPWNQIGVQSVFSHKETGTNITINGFYYDRNIWKLRFNPPLRGDWDWNLSMKFPDGFVYTKAGHLVANTDTKEKYIKINAQHPDKFTLDNKTEFIPIGIQDAVSDTNHNGTNLDDWSLEQRATGSSEIVDLNQYLNEYGKNGKRFNLYRFGVNNASFNLFDRLYVGAQPAIENAKMLDQLFENLQNNSFHIWMSLFSFYLNEKPILIEKNFLDEYVKYIIARYGVYVDIWEIGNEIKISDETAQYYSELIKSLDYEKRLVTTNWEKPNLDGVEIISLHRYDSDQPNKVDINLIKLLNQYTKTSKPIVFSEAGNLNSSWEVNSLDRMRIKIWTGLFNNTSFIFWNTTHKKDYYNSTMKNGNIYLGKDERQQIEVFNSFTYDIPLDSTRSKIFTSDPYVRGYAIDAGKMILGYFVCEHSSQDVLIDNFVRKAGSIEWINPQNGETIAKNTISASDRMLKLPACKIDLAMRLSYL